MRKNVQGYISIFLALISLPIFSLAILTIDIVKIVSARNHLVTSNEIARYSLLSRYDKTLYDKYKIFAIEDDDNLLTDYANYILQENVNNNVSRYYKVNLQNAQIKLDENSLLLNTENLEDQILEYMKLRAPYELGKGVVNLFNITKDSKKHIKVLEKKFDFEEEYSKINQDFSKIGERLIYYDENFDSVNSSFFDINIRLENLKEDIIVLLEEGNREINIISLMEQYTLENEKLSNELALMQVNFEEIITGLKKFSNDTEKLQKYKDEWKEAISNMEKSDIKSNFLSEYKSSNLQFTKENIDSLLKKLEEHKDTIKNMRITLESDLILYAPKLSKTEELISKKFNLSENKKLPSLNNYKIYKYINDTMYREKIEKQKVDEAKQQKKNLDQLTTKKEEVDIPSYGNLFDYISKDDFDKMTSFSENLNLNTTSGASIVNYKKILSQSADLISNSGDIKDNLSIALYIVNHFSDKINKNSEFDSQIEYILFGDDDLSKNNKNVENSIFAIRFLLNSLYAYTNADLGRETTMLATAIAGWTGFGVPIVKSALLGSMSFGESIIDLNTLNNGESLAGFKNKSSWQVSLSSVPSLLTKGLSDLTNSSIDNIFDFALDFSEQSLDDINSKIDQFSTQTIDGLSQSIISEILNPIQTAILSSLGNEVEKIKINIDQSISDVESNINKENLFINLLKREVLQYVKNEIGKSFEDLNELNIENYFNQLSNEIEAIILQKTSELTNTFKNNIRDSLNENRVEIKTKVNHYVKEYITKLGYSGSTFSKGSVSGINFDYKDYLTLLVSMRLSTANKANILRRMALVMNSEVKISNPDFDITIAITNFTLKSSIDINTLLLKKYIFIDEIIEETKGGY